MYNFSFLPTTNKPKKKKSHVKKMRPARRRCRGSQRRGTLNILFDSKITNQINNIQTALMAPILGPVKRGNVRHKPANHHQFYRGSSMKPLTRMMVSQKSQSQEIPLSSSQLCPVLPLFLRKDPVLILLN
ncbi:hypothetical protein ILYODFUR_036475 [Ilyodon furcidens]|uniref:Uncharacterized protein n=1 Tax=Ilyodon furcidens TaxID=33524 RepID=A0ABV0UED4_9TELE